MKVQEYLIYIKQKEQKTKPALLFSDGKAGANACAQCQEEKGNQNGFCRHGQGDEAEHYLLPPSSIMPKYLPIQ